MKILTIVGNRPQFIKLGVTARRLRELGDKAPFASVVVNTGQHYDEMLSDVFFTELEIEAPHYNLGMGSGHIVDQIGRMMAPLREVFDAERPDALLVYGDTNSTVAGALVAAHLGVPVMHVEGGERLYRRVAMPEETNRIVTDHLSDMCLVSSRKAMRYLAREGFGADRLRFVGDPMYDIFKLSGEMLQSREAAQPADFRLTAGDYGICTIHRAENTDDRDTCLGLLGALDGAPFPVLLPAHPRLQHRLQNWGWSPQTNLRLIDPLGYFDFQSLLRQSRLVITDSGGVGREAFFAGKPAIVPLESSAWIEAVEAGLAVMTGRSPDRLAAALAAIAPPANVTALVEENFGAGDAGTQIVDEIAAFVTARQGWDEGAWHPLGRFEQLPKAVDSAALSHAAFTDVARYAALNGWQAGQLLIDVTRGFDGAQDLLAIARAEDFRPTLLLDLASARFNPLSAAAGAQFEGLAGLADLAATDVAGAALLSQALGREVGVADPAGATADRDARGAPVDLNAAAKAGATRLHVQPWLWAATPVSPFESALRLVDADNCAAQADLTRIWLV
ncbi:UDP-N-acetyl glucosamine 2-epimerase [Sphingopyxis sp. MSC1_008]|jgi:UDP-GlcNAc3NAcA epimerase|uniref:UDP-N-acetyl glucosamine 2-epimerase n=1 Tax=Sphingopyxis sp. MSC1_008 TaxID=2909265 RepID=UPI0020BED16F|nr:UDP-N-acetyl glucosamine 2-epimerase [Sphingopyxis sp. MSC1_008]